MVRDVRDARSPPKDSKTLSSILSLAAGALALHPAGEATASIHAYSVGNTVVGFDTADTATPILASAGIDLPGASTLAPAQVKRLLFEAATGASGKSNFIRVLFENGETSDKIGVQSDGRSAVTYAGQGVAFRTANCVTWGVAALTASDTRANIIRSAKHRQTVTTGNGDPVTTGGGKPVYTSVFKGYGPGSFSDKYLLFKFMNTDARVNKMNYGWVHVASATRRLGVQFAMTVTFDAWAYQDDGRPIGAGQIETPVPEIDPANVGSAAALLVGALGLLEQRKRAASAAMGGALVAGAEGLRRWRRRTGASAGASAEG
jgi:hypothetical protein